MKPVALWKGADLHHPRTLTVILRTRGCRWKKCLMCSYHREGRVVSEDDILSQLDYVLERIEKGVSLVKIFTSGSFFDPLEISPGLRRQIIERLAGYGVFVESRPEFITPESLEDLGELEFFGVALGLETASDTIRGECINKGFSFEDFKRAASIVRNAGGKVKTYLLLKPPFLTENQAVRDVKSSLIAASPYTDIFSLNPVTVRQGTPLETLWHRGGYRPPWLWSIVEILAWAGNRGLTVISDPLGAGSRRGPHNCGKCDREALRAIQSYSLDQNPESLDVHCSCQELWEKVLELEDASYGALSPFM